MTYPCVRLCVHGVDIDTQEEPFLLRGALEKAETINTFISLINSHGDKTYSYDCNQKYN